MQRVDSFHLCSSPSPSPPILLIHSSISSLIQLSKSHANPMEKIGINHGHNVMALLEILPQASKAKVVVVDN